MQRPAVINNMLRTSTLVRRLLRRQSASPGVINLQTLPARQAANALSAEHPISAAAPASRFAVARAMPSQEVMELADASPPHTLFEQGTPPAPDAGRGVVRRAAQPSTSDEAPTVREASHAPRPQRETADSSDKLSAGRFRISRRGAPDSRAAHSTPSLAAGRPSPSAQAQDDAKARRGEAHKDLSHAGDAGTPGNFVVRRSPAKRAPGGGNSATGAGHPAADSTAPVGRQAHELSRDAAQSTAPTPRPSGFKSGAGMTNIVSRKHQRKRSAFSPKHSMLQRNALSGSLRRTANVPTEAQTLSAAHANPNVNPGVRFLHGASADGSLRTADDSVTMPPSGSRAERFVRTAARPHANSIGIGQNGPSSTILRKAHPAASAPVRRVESNNHADASASDGEMTRLIAPTRAARGESDVARYASARPVVMRQATARREDAAEPLAAQFETAGQTMNGAPGAMPAMPPPEIDIAQLAEQVSRIISRRLAVERERRGLWK